MLPYFIGQGTGIVKQFGSLEEMFSFHKNMPALDRHFCKLYDCIRNVLADGWDIQYDYSDPTKWRKI